MSNRALTPEQRIEAQAMRRRGTPVKDIAAFYGCSEQSIRRATDEFYRRTQNRLRSERRAIEGDARVLIARAERTVRKEDVEARLAEIPPDTRDLTGILCGDPIPNDPRRHWLRREA